MLSWMRKDHRPEHGAAPVHEVGPAKALPSLPLSAEKTIAPSPAQHVARPQAPPLLSPDEKDIIATAPFYCADGSVFRSVAEFGNALAGMSEETYAHHVNAERNDFANWIEGCFGGRVHDLAEYVRTASRAALTTYFAEPSEPVKTKHTLLLPKEALVHQHVELPPLPASPLHDADEKRVHSLLDDIHAVRMKAMTQHGEARDAFIALRARIWQECSEDERRLVLPKLRETYELLRPHTV